eukprot:6686452-Prymnesium_polylepis.2
MPLGYDGTVWFVRHPNGDTAAIEQHLPMHSVLHLKLDHLVRSTAFVGVSLMNECATSGGSRPTLSQCIGGLHCVRVL